MELRRIQESERPWLPVCSQEHQRIRKSRARRSGNPDRRVHPSIQTEQKKNNAALNSNIYISETGTQNTLKFGAIVPQLQSIMDVKNDKVWTAHFKTDLVLTRSWHYEWRDILTWNSLTSCCSSSEESRQYVSTRSAKICQDYPEEQNDKKCRTRTCVFAIWLHIYIYKIVSF